MIFFFIHRDVCVCSEQIIPFLCLSSDITLAKPFVLVSP